MNKIKCDYCSRMNKSDRETCVSCGALLSQINIARRDSIARLASSGYFDSGVRGEISGIQGNVYSNARDIGVSETLAQITTERLTYLDRIIDFFRSLYLKY